jgi:uncharacterized membrane protein (UPF0127 family)
VSGSPLVDVPEPLSRTALADPRAPTWTRWSVISLLVVAVAGLLAIGGGEPSDPFLATSRIAGFDEATLRILKFAPAAGRDELTGAEECVLLAAQIDQQARGLKGRTDLGGYPAMAFVFPTEVTTIFISRNVGLDFSVAWFDSEGLWVGSQDLAKCADVDGCPTAAAPAPYQYALETAKGGLADLGLGPGSQIAIDNGCA